jgi:hypothetical protein
VIVIQSASGEAVHAHSRAVATVRRPVPPAAGAGSLATPSVTPQPGSVEVAVDVSVEDPHAGMSATAVTARVIRRSEAEPMLAARMFVTAGLARQSVVAIKTDAITDS